MRLPKPPSLPGLLLCLISALILMPLEHHAAAGTESDSIYLSIQATGSRLIKVSLAGPAIDEEDSAGLKTQRVLEFDISQSNRFRLVSTGPELVQIMRLGVRGAAQRGLVARHADVFVVWDVPYTDNSSRFVFEGKVKDCATQKMIFSRRFEVSAEQQRAVIHQFVDEMSLMLSGKSGIAHCKIAFVSDRTGAKELYTADYDGYNVRQRTRLNRIVLSPAYSPKGDKIAFIRFNGNGPILSVLDLVTDRIDDVVSSEGIVTAPAWSPDGSVIALAISKMANCDIYLFDIASKQLKRLTYAKSIETSPCFAPNGRSVAFTSDRTGRPQIYVMNVDGAGQRRISFEGRHNESPAWSPDGRLIAYSSLLGSVFELRLTGPDGEGPYTAVKELQNGESPAWSPDGMKLMFSARLDGGGSDLFMVNRDGGGLTRVLQDMGNCTEPSWSP